MNQELKSVIAEGLQEYEETKAERATTLIVRIYRQGGKYFAVEDGRKIAATCGFLATGEGRLVEQINYNIKGNFVWDIINFAGKEVKKIILKTEKSMGDKKPLTRDELECLEYIARRVCEDSFSQVEIKVSQEGAL